MSLVDSNTPSFTFCLATSVLPTFGSVNEFGQLNLANYSDMTFTGVNLKQIVSAPVWEKAKAFQITCASCYTSRVGIFNSQTDPNSRSAMCLLSGLPFIGATTGPSALLGSCVLGSFPWTTGGSLSNSGLIGWNQMSGTFWKQDETVSLRIRYVRLNDFQPFTFDANSILLATTGYGAILPQQFFTLRLEPIFDL